MGANNCGKVKSPKYKSLMQINLVQEKRNATTDQLAKKYNASKSMIERVIREQKQRGVTESEYFTGAWSQLKQTTLYQTLMN